MTNEQRTMLEFAAKAAGYNAFEGHAAQMIESGWNPREDDAQCLQLARKLGISIDYVDQCAWFRYDDTSMTLIQEFWDGDCWATDREAVLAVAAQIGRML